MEFGVFILAQQRGYHQSSQQVINNAVEQTVIAEQAGFDTAWYAEHHFNNYSLCPSPLMMVAHCAGLTRRIRLGTAVCVLPLYNPARLLGDHGLLDGVVDDLLRALMIAALLRQNEYAEFHRLLPPPLVALATRSHDVRGLSIFEQLTYSEHVLCKI